MEGLVFLIILVGFMVTVSNKNKARKAKEQHMRTQYPRTEQIAMAASSQFMMDEAEQAAPRMMPMHDHDHAGSLGDLHDEGYDPCHEDQLAPAVDPALAAPGMTVPQTAPALSLSWTKDELVKGVVMAEILNRPRR